MHPSPILRCITLSLAVAAMCAGCTHARSADHPVASPAPTDITTGRTVDGYTYTNAPVDVTLGPTTFRIPANYLQSQITPWPGESVTIVLEWPDMMPTAPGARASPRTNDFRKEIHVIINYIDRVPIRTAVERMTSNEAVTEPGSLERKDPTGRLDFRIAQPAMLGLTPYAIDEARMAVYAREHEALYGKPPIRNSAFEDDWFVDRDATGIITTFIKCDNHAFRGDGVQLDGDRVIGQAGEPSAACAHFFSDVENSLLMHAVYKRVFFKDWRKIERAVRHALANVNAR